MVTRIDGVPAEDVPGYRRFMPALMPRRVDALVFFDQQLRIARAEEFLAKVRAEHPDIHPTIFHVVLYALVHTIDRHPHLNRFVAGGRVWQRKGIWFSYTAKTELSEKGVLIEIKQEFDPADSFADMVRAIQDAVLDGRSGHEGLADKELELFLHLPPILRRGVVRTASIANALNLLPRSFIEGDPFFASAFLTNLGSVGLDAAFHHLYEYGTIPIFVALGQTHDAPVVVDGDVVAERVVSVKFSYDERVEDGLYAGLALEDFRRFAEDPASGLPFSAQ
jgi:pyruvate/2-oxoglutarate dehydrogenase complex dihydrolipoamide acyltransferase (E2) component